jgi:hypothetical protein
VIELSRRVGHEAFGDEDDEVRTKKPISHKLSICNKLN